MSLPENKDDNKILTADNSEPGCNKVKCYPSTSYGNAYNQENLGAIPKNSKNVSANANNEKVEYNKMTKDLANNMEGLVLSTDSSEDNICQADWLKARDSLEHLMYTKKDKVDVMNSKSTSCTTKEKCFIGESPHSESVIGAKNCSNSVSKVLAWDPWEKLTRKNKKEMKRRKCEKSTLQETSTTATSSSDQNRKDFMSGDEIRSENVSNVDSDSFIGSYEYQPYQPKNTRSVEFTNNVMVVYIKEDKVVGETTEPLKKELEQQIRNKEMRKGHMADVGFARKRIDWFKK